jgi:hypothetical protein
LRIAKHPSKKLVAIGGSLEDPFLKIMSLDTASCLAMIESKGEINGV